MTTPPRWIDRKKVIEYAVNQLDGPDPYIDKMPPYHLPGPARIKPIKSQHDFVRMITPVAVMRDGAVEFEVNPNVSRITVDGWFWIAEQLAVPKKPKKKGEKLNWEEREQKYGRLYLAVDEARSLAKILKEAYPKQSMMDVQDLAVAIATGRNKIKTDLRTHILRYGGWDG